MKKLNRVKRKTVVIPLVIIGVIIVGLFWTTDYYYIASGTVDDLTGVVEVHPAWGEADLDHKDGRHKTDAKSGGFHVVSVPVHNARVYHLLCNIFIEDIGVEQIAWRREKEEKGILDEHLESLFEKGVHHAKALTAYFKAPDRVRFGYEIEALHKANTGLEEGDVITGFNGQPVTPINTPWSSCFSADALNDLGFRVESWEFNEKRDVENETVTSTLVSHASTGWLAGNDSDQYLVQRLPLGVLPKLTARLDPEFLEAVTVDRDGRGDSGSLMYGLAMLNAFTETDLAGGKTIAGSGRLRLNGKILSVNGVAQKVMAAESEGIEIFLISPYDYEEAKQYAEEMHVIPVDSIYEALKVLTH